MMRIHRTRGYSERSSFGVNTYSQFDFEISMESGGYGTEVYVFDPIQTTSYYFNGQVEYDLQSEADGAVQMVLQDSNRNTWGMDQNPVGGIRFAKLRYRDGKRLTFEFLEHFSHSEGRLIEIATPVNTKTISYKTFY